MRRREVLALVAAFVPLAGCSGDGGGDSETESTTDDDGAADSVSTDGTDTDGNTTDDVDGVDDAGDDGQSDGTGSDPVEEAIASARSSLQDAVDELDFGSAHARAEIDATAVDDALQQTRLSIDDAREGDPDDGQAAPLDSIELAEQAVRALFEALDPFRAAADAIEDAQSDASSAADEFDSAASELGGSDYRRLDAIEEETVQTQAGTLGADLEAAGAIADALGPLLDAEEIFWPPFRELAEGALAEGAESDFESASSSYASAADSARPGMASIPQPSQRR